jgi:hypothetical protein
MFDISCGLLQNLKVYNLSKVPQEYEGGKTQEGGVELCFEN